ncbi:MAG TPA: hypothetical protein VKE40_07480 [Gemmataceae bacterium]|nr:hypothetical protein [Gemmataceae bacterium]
MRLLSCLAIIAIGPMVTASGARAQSPIGAPPPAYSPYLNLIRPGANPALNYYGLVRPQQDFARTMQSIQGQLLNTQQAIADQASGDLTTGHPTYFMNYGGYFMNTGSGMTAPAGATRVPAVGGLAPASRYGNRR